MESVTRETCLEYFRRRVSEGWKVISLEGYNAVLLSPSGIRRAIDLRNDVETLRPNAAGDETSIASQFPDSTFHWDKVDEAVPDEGDTRVYTSFDGYQRDLYNLPASSGVGTISSIKIYVMGKYTGFIKPSMKNGATVTDGTPVALGATWVLSSDEWALNPADAAPFEWADIDALQIGVSITGDGKDNGACDQVYVEVNYTLPPAVGSKSANMGARMMAAGVL